MNINSGRPCRMPPVIKPKENANNATRVNHPLDIVVDAPVQVWLDCNRDYWVLGLKNPLLYRIVLRLDFK